MGSFEWMELQTLTSEITTARSRLTMARSSKNAGRVRGLEEEIAGAEARRAQLLSHITTNLAITPGPAPGSEATEAADISQGSPDRATSLAAPAKPILNGVKGGCIVWDRLTPGDIARATNELDARRSAILARHAEELKGLDTDQTQLESLEQAIAAFVRKFNRSSPRGEIVTLGEDRSVRLQAHG